MIVQMAWRNIWRNKARSFVIMLSVAIGCFAGIAVLALYKGMMKGRVRIVIDREVAHLQVHHPEFKKDFHPAYLLPGANDVLHKIQSLPAVLNVAPRSIVQGMLVTTTGSAGVQINGVVPGIEYKVSQLKNKITTGEGFHTGKKNEILIGRKLADKMKLKTGSKLVLTFTDTADNIISSAFRVSGIYQSGNAPLDEWNVYITITTLNELLGTENAFHEIAVLLQEDDEVQAVQSQLQQQFPFLLVENWKEISPETDLMVRTVDEYSYIIMVIILIALAFGILNTMLMSVLERTREIGMIMAIGMSRLRIFLLILYETLYLTLVGAPFGLLAAYLVTRYYQKQGLDLSNMGKDLMESFGFSTRIYPSFPWDNLAAIMMMVAGTAIISCILPAIKALRLKPVEALRR